MESFTVTQQDSVFILTEYVMELRTARMGLTKMRNLVVREYLYVISDDIIILWSL